MDIIICDDTASDRKRLIYCLNKLADEYAINLELHEYTSATDLLGNSANYMNTDVIFLDIFMMGMDGMEAARKLRSNGYEKSLMFTTSSTEHAIESYSVKADGYLVKPYNYDTFYQSIWRLQEQFLVQSKKVNFITDRVEVTLSLSEILFFESSNKGTLVHTLSHTYFTWKKIGDFEEESADEQYYYKLNRSFILNLNHIKHVTDTQIIMKDGSAIDIPVRSKLQVKQDIADYLVH